MNKFDSILKKCSQINQFHSLDIEHEWDAFKDMVKETMPDDTIPDSSPSKPKIVSILNVIRTSAAILVLIFIFLFSFKQEKSNRVDYHVSKSAEIIILSDGSSIALAKNAKINYPLSFKNEKARYIVLEGEATFDVKKNILPFIVRYDSIDVRVLGTKFILKKDNNGIYIKNIEGSVKVSSISNSENYVILKPNDELNYMNGQFNKLNIPEVIEKSDVQYKDKVVPKLNLDPDINSNDSYYKLGSLIKVFLAKQNRKQVKIDRRLKYDEEQKIKLNLNMPLKDILEALKLQGLIDIKPGKCEDCYIVVPPSNENN